jgi:hypothetical protein
MRPRHLVFDLVKRFDRIAQDGIVILLNKAKESIYMTKEFLIVMSAITMVVVMPSAASGQSKWNDILWGPGQIKLRDGKIGTPAKMSVSHKSHKNRN